MKKVKRYLLQVADGDDETIEISKEQAEQMMDENPEIEVEEMDEDELDLEVVGAGDKKRGGKKRRKSDEDFEEEEEFEDFEEDEDEEFEEEFEEKKNDGCGGKRRRKKDEEEDFEEEEFETTDEDEDEEEDFEKEELETTDEDGEGSDMIYEVQFDDGTVGKMDENSYKHVSRFLEVSKKGDAAQTIAKATLLTSNAAKVLGPTFDVTKFIANDSIDYTRIKKAIIKKVMPNVVTTSLKGDALERVYSSAMDTFKSRRSAWERDVEGISKAAVADSGSVESPVDEARANYLKRQAHN